MEFQNDQKPELDGRGINELLTASKWARFIAIVGFVFIGLLVIMAFFAGSMMRSFSAMGPSPISIISGGFITFIYLIIALVYFFPCLFLFQFADKTNKAIQNGDNAFLNEAMSRLRAHYQYVGILMIIALALYAIMFMVFLASGGMMMH